MICRMWVEYHPVCDGFTVWATTGEEGMIKGSEVCICLDDWDACFEPPQRWLHLPLVGSPFKHFESLGEAMGMVKV
jgi:hypothetical protein